MLEWNKPTVDESMRLGYEAFVPEREEIEPSTLDVAAATLRTENPAAALAESLLYYKSEEEDQVGYNPYDHLPDEYLPYSDAFLDVKSPDQMMMKQAQIDSQLRDRRIMQEGGAESVGWSLVAGLGDPVNFPLMILPPLRMGAGALKVGAITAGMGAAEAAISESILHELQPTRTWQESMFAVGGTALLGGSFGALTGAGQKRTMKALEQADKDIKEIYEAGGLTEIPEGTVGAARVVGTAEEEGSMLLGPAINPGIWLLKSKAANSRNFANEAWRHNFFNGKNLKTAETVTPDGKTVEVFAGAESSVPVDVNIARRIQGDSAKYIRTLRESYQAMKGARTFAGARMARGMRFGEFADEVGKSMRRGDTSDIPEIASAASKIRKDVIAPITKGFQELGDLPEELATKFARSYLPRVYDVRGIERNYEQWKEMLTQHFTGKKVEVKERGLVTLDADDAGKIADDITDTIMGSPSGKMHYDIVGSTGRLKERVLDIHDEVLEEGGFLINNVDTVMRTYMRSTVPELELKMKFGDHELETVMQNIRDEYTVLENAVKTNKEKVALRAELEGDIKRVKGLRDIYLGRNLPARGSAASLTNMARTVRGLSFMANLGMMTISAVPDMARPIMQHGVRAWAKSLPRAMLYYGKKTKLARRQLEEIGIGVDNLLNSRIYAMADIDETGTRLQKATQQFARYSGMNHWNSVMKKVAAFTAQNRFIDDAAGYAGLSIRRKARLAKAGINEGMAKRISKQYAEHGEKLGTSKHANTAEWTDREAARLFEDSLLKDVDNTIVTPGVADRPLFMSSELGKTILQFKTFFLASHNQTFIPLMQQMAQKDVSALVGIFTGVALGMIGEWARLNISGRGDELENYTMQDWARAGLDRSGLATVPNELFNMTDRMLEGALSESMGLSEGSRYFYRNMLGTAMGPTASYVEDAGKIATNLVNGDGVTDRDIHGIRRLMPYQNMFYLRQGLNKMEDEIVKSTGAKKTRRRRTTGTYIQ